MFIKYTTTERDPKCKFIEATTKTKRGDNYLIKNKYKDIFISTISIIIILFQKRLIVIVLTNSISLVMCLFMIN